MVNNLNNTLTRQKMRSLSEGIPSISVRLDRLDRLMYMMIEFQDHIPDVLVEDFGHRSPIISKFSDIAAVLDSIRYIKKNLKRWMKPDIRFAASPFNWFGAKAHVRYQPVGSVGIIGPWNYPFNLIIGPLAAVLAAGNRAMIKPSELAPKSSNLVKRMISEYFEPEEIAVVLGDGSVGEEFSKLAFDHLFFTGSTAVAKKIMAAAATHLVPVTLELGGKSPVIVGCSADLKVVADRVWNGKLMNGGQTCIAPDYLFIPEESLESWIEASTNSIASMFPLIFKNEDYTSIINVNHFERLQEYLEDARRRGAQIIEFNPGREEELDRTYYKLMPSMIVDVNDDMLVMKEEIFGPIMPIKTYRKIDDAIRYINNRSKPLSLYYFGQDKTEEIHVLENTISGGVSINDVIFHYVQDDLPFGGVGASGMGRYHGIEGFKTFSNPRAVYRQTPIDFILKIMRPPFGHLFKRIISSRIKF